MPEEYVTWTVGRVAKKLKNRFVGTVKMKGEIVAHVVEALMTRYLIEEKDKEQKERKF